MRAEEVRRAVAGRRVDEPELVVVAHQRPDVRRAARVLLAVGGLRVDARPSHVPRPRKLPGDHVVSAHDARGLVDFEVVRDARADDCEVACDQRRRRDQVDVRLRFADALHQVDCTFVAEAGAALAGLRIDRHETRIGRAHDDARRTIAAVACGGVVVADAAARAVEADRRDLHLRIELPALRAGLGIERYDDVHRRAHVQQLADLQRRRFELSGAAGAVVPDLLQSADVRRVDLVETGVSCAMRRVAVVAPFAGTFRRSCLHLRRIARGQPVHAVVRSDDEDRQHREHARGCDRAAAAGAEQRGRRLRRVESATREGCQQPRSESTQECESRRERPQIRADFVQRPGQRRREQRAENVRAELVAAPQKNRRREQRDTRQHVVEGTADRKQPHAAIEERHRHDQDDRSENARRPTHHFPFGRNASNTLPGA